MNFINFDSTEVDTVILKKYEKGTGFVQQIDTTFFQEGDYRIKRRGDTIYFPVRSGDFGLTKQFDYIIVLPQTFTEFKITEIVIEQIRSSCAGKVQCGNPIISLKIDNNLFYFKENGHDLYIKK
ncbi:MAG: hypothetical protein M3352_06290 [Bacteroidota bacterium]|nr:hypothetical protein [Bacteroidota bacterium]